MNIALVLRMYYEHGYTVQQIHERLRHSEELIRLVIKNHRDQQYK